MKINDRSTKFSHPIATNLDLNADKKILASPPIVAISLRKFSSRHKILHIIPKLALWSLDCRFFYDTNLFPGSNIPHFNEIFLNL